MSTVYALKLEQEKYYIGKTNKPMLGRYQEHLDGIGSSWTAKYKPIKILEEIANADVYEEDKQTKKYMNLYGIDNVRGGSYVSIKLPYYQKQALKKEICTLNNLCFRCMKEGHYANKCPKNYVWACDYCDNEYDTEKQVIEHVKICPRKIFGISSSLFSDVASALTDIGKYFGL